MTTALFDKHRSTLDGALNAIHTRSGWSPYSEMPSPKVFGETAADDGKRAFESQLGQPMQLAQPGPADDFGQGVLDPGWRKGHRQVLEFLVI